MITRTRPSSRKHPPLLYSIQAQISEEMKDDFLRIQKDFNIKTEAETIRALMRNGIASMTASCIKYTAEDV